MAPIIIKQQERNQGKLKENHVHNVCVSHISHFYSDFFLHSLDKLLGAITTAAERNNRERFSPIVEGLENHEALQLQVS